MTSAPLLTTALTLLIASSAVAQTTPAKRTTRSCFNTGSNVIYRPVDRNTILVRDGRSYYRITVGNCTNLEGPSPVIINKIFGTTQICGPLDLQLTVLDTAYGIPQPCIAQSVAELTPDEIAATPKKFKP